MHNFGLLREALGNIARWRDISVLIHIELDNINQEKYIAIILGDIALLKYAGIDIFITCIGKRTDFFVKRAAQRNVEVYPIGHIVEIEDIAQKRNVVKVFFLCEGDGIYHNGLIHEMTVKEAVCAIDDGFLSGTMQEKLQMGVKLCMKGVRRVHFVNGKRNGAFLDEFLSSKGSGTMVYDDTFPYKVVEKVKTEEVVDVVSIIQERVDSSIVEEVVMQRVDDVTVFSVDGYVHAVIISSYNKDKEIYQVDYLAHSEEFDASEALNQLLQCAIEEAEHLGAQTLVVDPNKAPKLIGIQPWFLQLGFVRSKQNSHYKWWQKKMSGAGD